MVKKIGYQTKNPNERDPADLAQYYQKLNVTDNYFNNGINAAEWGQNKVWATILKPTDRELWDMTSPTVNAYYQPPLNEIVFPAGIMQIPTFSGELPEYISYGAFGAVVGHEMTHGFDDNGAKYDDSGRYREWWDNGTTTNFDKKTECFVKQYSEFTVEGMDKERVHVNGKLTLGENVADSGGLNNAYAAWKKRETASKTQNPGLPGLEKFMNDQLFFIGYANSWCEMNRKEALLKQVYTDPHSPSDKRIIGTLDNSKDFKEAFNCPAKEARCNLW
jgi:endothelin-converting enzyme